MTSSQSAKAIETKEIEAFGKYIAERKVVIADPSSSARTGMARILSDLGAQTTHLALANNYEDAAAAVAQLKPHVIIVEYDLDKRCGLELLQAHRELRSPEENKECLAVVLTGNTSQTAVARAAEEDLDAYILKPYTPATVRRTLLQAAIRKIKPTPYQLSIEAGKKLLDQSKVDEAEAEFKRAATLDASPSMAYYYLGQIKLLRQVIEESKGNYQKGLGFNRIHYKCLVGLYELLMKQNAHQDAYEVVKKLSQYFPANPKRLIEILRLAIVTGKYDDIEKYYAVFTNIDERNETLIKYVCASLVVCGKHYLSSGMGHRRALELFGKAAATGQGRANILKEIILALLDHGMTKEANAFMERFPPEAHNSEDAQLMRFLISDAEDSPAMVINQGRTLMARNCADERLYEALIRRGVQAKLSQLAMDEIMGKAASLLPEKKARFEQLLKEAREKAATDSA